MDKKQNAMKDVCSSRHAALFVACLCIQSYNLLKLCNDKFAKPATAVRNELTDKGKLMQGDFDAKPD